MNCQHDRGARLRALIPRLRGWQCPLCGRPIGADGVRNGAGAADQHGRAETFASHPSAETTEWPVTEDTAGVRSAG